MIKIRKGTQILTVPARSFKEFYEIAGWQQIVPQTSSWEKEIKGLSNAELKKLAQDRGLETAGVSKKTLVETLLKMGK